MATYSTNLTNWGSVGSAYPTNYNYLEGEQPVDEWDNFFNNEVANNIQTIMSALTNDIIQTDGSNPMAANLDLGGNSLVNVNGADHETEWHAPSETGTVVSGNAGMVFQTTLADTETLTVSQASLVAEDGTAVASGVDLIIADITNGVSEAAIISGDGTTVYSDVTSGTTYTNTSGVDEQVAILVDNGHFNAGSGADRAIAASSIARVN